MIPLLLKLLCATWRIRLPRELPDHGVVMFWHDEMLPLWYVCRGMKARAVVSLSKDGGLLTEFLQGLGYTVLRGSSAKGGKEVMANLQESLHSGALVLMTPDGSRGPRHVMKPGAIVAAIRSGAPAYIARAVPGRSLRLEKSWDKFELPLPFTSVEIEIRKVELPADDGDRDAVEKCIRASEDALRSMRS